MVGPVISGIELHERLGVRNYELVAKGLQWNGPREMEKALTSIDMRDAVIADIGCGTGQLSEIFLWHAAREIIAVDAVPEFLTKVMQDGRADRVVMADVQYDKLRIPDESVDLVTASGLFTYIANPAHAINEMVRITKFGGHIAVNFHPSQNPIETRAEQVGAPSLGKGFYEPVYKIYHHSPVDITGRFTFLGTDPVHMNTTTKGVLRYGTEEQWLPLTTCVYKKVSQPYGMVLP